jgi:hypothetical protein
LAEAEAAFVIVEVEVEVEVKVEVGVELEGELINIFIFIFIFMFIFKLRLSPGAPGGEVDRKVFSFCWRSAGVKTESSCVLSIPMPAIVWGVEKSDEDDEDEDEADEDEDEDEEEGKEEGVGMEVGVEVEFPDPIPPTTPKSLWSCCSSGKPPLPVTPPRPGEILRDWGLNANFCPLSEVCKPRGRVTFKLLPLKEAPLKVNARCTSKADSNCTKQQPWSLPFRNLIIGLKEWSRATRQLAAEKKAAMVGLVESCGGGSQQTMHREESIP